MAKSGIYRGSPLGPECQSVDVSNGSKPEVAALRRDVCFTPESGNWTDIPGGPFCADFVAKVAGDR